VQLAKKRLQFGFRRSALQKKCGFWFRFYARKLTAVSFFWFDAFFHLRLYSMILEMSYFRAELVQIIASRSDSELEVQRYSMKKNTFTVDAIIVGRQTVNETT